jgi:hypothetical protein
MKLSDNNLARLKKTVFGAPDMAEKGLYGSSFFALLRCIRMFGEEIDCTEDSKLHGLKALSVGNGEYVAVRKNTFAGGSMMCTFYWLEDKKAA